MMAVCCAVYDSWSKVGLDVVNQARPKRSGWGHVSFGSSVPGAPEQTLVHPGLSAGMPGDSLSRSEADAENLIFDSAELVPTSGLIDQKELTCMASKLACIVSLASATYTHTNTVACNFITGQNKETTQNTIVTESAACASYKRATT
jgi:hypothetical protein